MAQMNPEPYGGKTESPYTQVDSTQSQTGERGSSEAQDGGQQRHGDDVVDSHSERQFVSDAPTSQSESDSTRELGREAPTSKVESDNARELGGVAPTSQVDNNSARELGRETPTSQVDNDSERQLGREAPTSQVESDSARELGREAPTSQIDNDSESQLGREAPTSQVGYGGSGGSFNKRTSQWASQSHANDYNGDGTSNIGGGGDFGGEQRGESRDGTVDPDTHPSQAGFGNSGPGSFPGERQQTPHQEQYGGLPHPTRPEGAVLLSESKFPGPKSESNNSPQTTTGSGEVKASQTSGLGQGGFNEGYGYGENAEVRNGVPHRVLSEGVASGAGVSNDAGNSTGNVEKREYHQTGDPLLHKDSPYSQQFTERNENTGDGGVRVQQDEDTIGNTEGGTFVGQQEKNGFTTKVKQMLPGHNKHEDSTNTVDGTEQDPVAADDETPEKEGFLTKLKHKMHPGHQRHKDEIDPQVYE